MRERARLRGLPGIRSAPGGAGRLTGAVHRNLAGSGPVPLPAVSVRVIGIGEGDGRGLHEQVATGEDGAFAFEALPALVGYALIVEQAPFKEVVLKGLTVRRDRTTDVGTIVLGASTSLTGHVVDGGGRPVPGALAQVFFDRTRPRRFDVRRGLIDLQSAVDPLAEARAWRDGRFDLANLPPGRYVVRVSAPGYATAFRESVWVTADERASSLHVVLDRGAGYEGRVVDPDERGIGGARVIAVAFPDRQSSRLDRVETTASSDGRYRLDGLVAGVRYFVEAWAEGYAPAGRFVQPEEIATLDFTLPPSGRVEGRITDSRDRSRRPGCRGHPRGRYGEHPLARVLRDRRRRALRARSREPRTDPPVRREGGRATRPPRSTWRTRGGARSRRGRCSSSTRRSSRGAWRTGA